MLILLSIWIIIAGFSLVGGFVLFILELLTGAGLGMSVHATKKMQRRQVDIPMKLQPQVGVQQQSETVPGYEIVKSIDNNWTVIDTDVDYMSAKAKIEAYRKTDITGMYMIRKPK